VVAVSLTLSVPSIRRNPQDTSAFYLAHIYQELSTQPNGSKPSILSSLSDPNETYTPPTSAVWVNGLWSMSLVISLTCAILATLVQRWAHRYLMVAYPRSSYYSHKKARIRAFYRRGVEKLHIPWAIEVLPALLHLSLFLYFAGLSLFIFGLHPTISKIVTAWIVICVTLYACVTFLPIIRKDSPYSSPFSASVSFCLAGIQYRIFQLRNVFLQCLLQMLPDIDYPICMSIPFAVHLDGVPSHDSNWTAEEYALRLPPNVDHGSLLWTFESLDEDTDLEKFFEGLATLCDSEAGKHLNLQECFIVPHKKRFSSALIQLMNRTLSSNLVPEFVKQRRMIICTKAVESTSLLGPWWILRCVLLGDWCIFLGCIEFGLFVQNWKSINHPVTSFFAQCVAAFTISIVKDRDEHWFELASGLLDATEPVLNEYVAHGDSILLAIAIFIARRTVQTYSGSAKRHREDILGSSSRTLEMVCELDIGCTLPELQHQFCGLWNQLVHTARTDQCPHHVSIAMIILKNIRQLYIALHERSGTPPVFYNTTDDRILDNPMLYPMCTIDGHHPSQVPDLQFDEPVREPVDPPNFMPMPIPTFPPSTFPFFHSSSPASPYLTLPVPSHHGAPFVDQHHYLAAPPVAVVHFPLHLPHASSDPSGGNAQLQPRPRPPPRSISVSSLYLDCESCSSSVLSGEQD
jgi:Family of unknown function (DUF6535)